jgi:uncharacterized membrane protein
VRIRFIAAAIIAALAVLALMFINPAARPRCTELEGAETLSVPLDTLAIGVPAFFCYHDHRGEQLRFVLARARDGQVGAVFDACRQCYKYREGFTAAGGNLVCRLCGNRYPVEHMTAGKASCAPVALGAEVKGGAIKVKVSDLKRGAALF